MLGRKGRAGWLRHIRTPRTNEPDSRKDAKYAKIAKNGKHLHFAILSALASWRELFSRPSRVVGQAAPTSRGWLQGDVRHTGWGLQKDENITNEATMLLKTNERIVETN